MAAQRSLIDRVMQRIAPRPMAAVMPPPRQLAPDVWLLERQLRMPGGPYLPLCTTIVRLRSGAVVVISPPPLIEAGETVAAIDAIGPVRWIVAPNSFHHVYVAAFSARYPTARVLVSPGLPDRVGGLPPAALELGARAPEDWAGELDVAVLGPVRGLSEVVFFHQASGVLILTDLAFNMTRFARRFDRLFWRVNGVPAGFGPSRTARMLLLRDRVAATRCLRQVAQWPMRQIVVSHGAPVEQDAHGQFLRAFAGYLRDATPG